MVTKQEIMATKYLISEGYKDKQIQMITRLNQPYISKVRNNKIQKAVRVEEGFSLDPEQQKRKDGLDRILSLKEFYTEDTEQDNLYISVLRFFLADKEEVFEMYNHYTKSRFSRIWAKKKVDLVSFRSELIGLDYKTYLELIVDFLLD